MNRNIGEGIAIFGVMMAIAITENYWLLFFVILPIYTWLGTDNDTKKKYNDNLFKRNDLELEKLREEIRLLKVRKK